MLSAPKRREIDHRTMKLIVGVIAILLPIVTSSVSHDAITSISASYYEGGLAASIFVGFLFAIASFLLAYNGFSAGEMVASKIAAAAALAVALFPCGCGNHPEIIPGVHLASAAVMFIILAYFCFGFFERARAKGHLQGKARAWIYAACGLVIVVSTLSIVFDSFSHGAASATIPRFTFYNEWVALFAFGFSWLIASRVIPWITRDEERFSLISDRPGNAAD